MNNIKRFFRKIAVSDLMTYIVATMALVFVGDFVSGGKISLFFCFSRSLIFQGQIWRAITFLGLPLQASPLFIIFSLMFYFSIGRELEAIWGSNNVTMYLLTGALLTIAGGFISGYTENYNLYLSLFLAYATIIPNTTFMLFFVIPVKAKWLAWLDAAFMVFSLIFGSWSERFSIIAAFATYFIFFNGLFLRPIKNKFKHRDFINQMKRSKIKVNKK